MIETEELQAGIAALEAQRAVLGDGVVDRAVAALRERLATLRAEAAAPASGPTLKQATVLFLDVVNSTLMSRALDPEDIQAIMDGAFEAFTAIIGEHGGRVLNYTGDGFLAVFGAPGAREDDAERAVRAGLALIAGAKTLAQSVKAAHDIDGFDVRVGIHTGQVLLGGGGDADHNIWGSAVNLAARMEQTAPTGALRISHDTYRQVRGVFDFESQPAIAVKGIDEPLITYLVLRAKPRAFRVATRGIEGVDTRMVGREAELERLRQAYASVRRERSLQVVAIVAEAGIGKSRLLDEFQNWASAQPGPPRLFHGRAHPQTQTQPYGLLRDVLARWLQIADSDTMEVAKQKLEQGIVPWFEAEDGVDLAQSRAHLLGHLIGLDFGTSRHIAGIRDDGKQIRSRAFHAAARLFRRIEVVEGVPLILLLDDLHWADEGSLDFLHELVDANRDSPLLLLALTRPALFERRADWARLGRDRSRIDLRPLDPDSSRELADELLKKLREVPASLREMLTSGAEGNPFYMEELVKMLVDEGAISTGADGWNVRTERLSATHVPQTLTGVLQARLDGLQPGEKLALQQASVIGLVFWDQALAAIDGQAVSAMPALERRELIVPRQDADLEGVREYAFHHQLLHQVTYDTLLKRTRREIHAKVAAWLAARTGVHANDFLGATAEHFHKGGDDRQACEFYARAATYAAGRYAHEAAMDHVAHALALIGMDARPGAALQPDGLLLRWRLLDVRERTLEVQGRRDEQKPDIAALEALAEALDDDHKRADAAWRRCDFALRTADFQGSANAARQAMAIASQAGDDPLRLRAQQRLASALTMQGDVAAGKAMAHEGLASARVLGLRREEGLFLNLLTIIASMQDDHVGNLELSQKRLGIDRETGNQRGEAITLGNLGIAWLALGANEHARRDLEEALRLTRAVGDRAGEPLPLYCLSELALRRGDAALARACAQSALDIAREVRAPESEASALCSLGNAELASGNHAAAAAAFEQAHAAAQAIEDAMQYDAAAGRARVALAQDDVARALEIVAPLLDHLASGGTLDGTEGPRLIELTCHLVLARASDPRAAGLLASSHAALQARADAIGDATLRRGFIDEIPEHRAIVAAWNAR